MKKKEILPSLFETSVFADKKDNAVKPIKEYTGIELFAGAGGLALGFELAGIKHLALNEFDKFACASLRLNKPEWNVIEGDVHDISFSEFKGKIDVVSGGFPCQAFSYAGKKLGFEDARGTLFFEFARVIKEVKPVICIGENVRGLLSHENGKTLEGMISVLDELGYKVVQPVQFLRATQYKVPQKRERLIIVGVRKDIDINYYYPAPYPFTYTVKDALKKGVLYDCDCPVSEGRRYAEKKAEVFKLVPPGGYWKDLPEDIAKAYMGKGYYQGGGRTGVCRRLSWDEPSLTLTCAPDQNRTERCHPEETRPLTIREYARIQTFPDEWQFTGNVENQYKQIGNAVPVNLAREIGYSVVDFLNRYYSSEKPE